MINFRYHVISLIAVFLALGIGIIMGTSVIDRAVVDRLERQQETLQADVDEVRSENNRLRGELRAERDAVRRLSDEGAERLLDGDLAGVPVLVVGVAGEEPEGLDALLELLAAADADRRGTLWLSERFRLEGEGDVRALGEALEFPEGASAGTLRSAALSRLARALRPVAEGAPPAPTANVLPALLDAGFLEYSPPEGAPDQPFGLEPGTRIVLVSSPDAPVPDRLLTLPLLRDLVDDRPDGAPSRVLAVTAGPAGDEAPADDAGDFVGAIREDRMLRARVATVDDLEDLTGRLAAVLALADLGGGRIGHYGTAPGADRLVPAPAG